MNAQLVAEYFLQKDVKKAQVVYLAKYEKKLFNDVFVAYDNGPVVESIMNSYGSLIEKNNSLVIDEKIKNFLDKIYMSLENAFYEEFIEITHEDLEWIKLRDKTYNAPVMNIEEYKKRYKGLIEALKL